MKTRACQRGFPVHTEVQSTIAMPCIQAFRFSSVSGQIEAWNRATKGGENPRALWGAERETLHRGGKAILVCDSKE
jgi:hypothetical protein